MLGLNLRIGRRHRPPCQASPKKSLGEKALTQRPPYLIALRLKVYSYIFSSHKVFTIQSVCQLSADGEQVAM
jgi:hypothetical protein